MALLVSLTRLWRERPQQRARRRRNDAGAAGLASASPAKVWPFA